MVFHKNLSWQGYFSFNEIKDIGSSTAVIAASETLCFLKYFRQSNKTTTTVDGLGKPLVRFIIA
jgi:hypothetical protein